MRKDENMREQEDICCTCKKDVAFGCRTSIKEKDVVKVIGVVGCRQYEVDAKKSQYYGPWHMPNYLPEAPESTEHAQAEGR
jgi:hypothetical protein